MAGVDTTSNYLAMMIYLTVQHPEVEEKVRAEIAEHMKADDYSTENLKKFKYIDCVQKETTRFFGPVNGVFMRNCTSDHTLGNVPVYKGTFAYNQPIGIHYS